MTQIDRQKEREILKTDRQYLKIYLNDNADVTFYHLVLKCIVLQSPGTAPCSYTEIWAEL